jgi:thiol-disulfide isomerase/thioredoxin
MFSSMADSGNGAAIFWLIEHAMDFVQEGVELGNYLRGYYEDLAENHASAQYIDDAMTLIMKSRRVLGEPFVFDFLHSIQNNSRRRRTASMALHLEASALVARGSAKDPERRARAEEIWYILIDGYPGTKAAKYAGSPLLRVLIEEMRLDQVIWVTQAEKLHGQGIGPEGWGTFPFQDHGPYIQTISGAGHPIAKRWSDKFFPGMEQASRDGMAALLLFETSWLGRSTDVGHADWVRLRYRLLGLMFAAYPDLEGTFEAVALLGKHGRGLDQEHVPRVLSNLIKATSDERIMAEAKTVLATVLTRSALKVDLDRATALFEDVVSNAPLDRQKAAARELGLNFSWTMPGAVHSTLNLMDSDDQALSTLSYRGNIIYMFFWSLNIPGCKEELPFVNELYERYAGSSVRTIGINGEISDLRGFRRSALKLGIKWRNCLLQEPKNWVAATMGVFTYPQGIVIDDKGVIRGRGLNHEETFAMVDQLLAEMAARGTTAAPIDTGKLRGLVRYGGSEPALPPLSLPDVAIQNCTLYGGTLDLTNRKRLVSKDGGLANVVLSVQVPDHIASGVGQKFRVQRSQCRYEPHMTVIPQGARLEVTNGDQAPHGAGARSLHNTSFNVVLPPGGTYDLNLNALDRFQVSSDTNPWMSSWVVVTDTPFFVISDGAGEFSIAGLPPGKYMADWWHESLGAGQTAEFEVTAAGTALIELVVGGQ